jgi:NAD(P)-dependent dehydrogenase (short-subunit alcohol dehydrogenase family)
LVPRGIRVNVIIRGPVKTQLSKKGGESEEQQKNFEEATLAKIAFETLRHG